MPEHLRASSYWRGWLALAGLAAMLIALRGVSLWHDHSLNSIDGALQTWFALDHFARGDQLGTAFQSYLGITMVLALLPVFFAFGQTLFASTLAAQMMVAAGAFGAAYGTAWMARSLPRRTRWQAAVVIVFVFYYAGRMAAETIGLAYPASLDPGVSLRPLRGFLPFMVLPVFVMGLRSALHGQRAGAGGLMLGLAAGAGLLWSNDAGIPLIIALALGLASALHQRMALLARMIAAFGLGVMASAGAILLAVTHGAPGPWLQYNFRDVAGDQFWFFAPWERSTRILGAGDLPNILRHADPLSGASLIVLTACVLWAMLQRLRGRGSPLRLGAFVFVGSSLIGTALIPQIGGHVGAEYNAITFVLGACAPLILLERRALRLARPVLARARPRLAATMPGALAGLAALGMVGAEAGRLAQTVAATDRVIRDPALGFLVSPAYAADLQAMRRLAAAWDAQEIPGNRRLLSVYTSPLDIAARVQSPAPVGSLIHALGSDNRAAFTALVANRKVAAVTTIAPDYSGWEGWITRANWPFFAALLQNYRPVARNDQQILWVRSAPPAPASLSAPAPAIAAADCRVSRLATGALAIDVTAPVSGLASVTVTRSGPLASGRGTMLTVVESSPETAAPDQDRWADFPRYGIPNSQRLSLLVPVAAGGSASRLRLDRLDGSAIGAASCTAQVFAPPALAALPGLPQGIAAVLAGGQP
jgi:hypothetical protein